MHGVTISRRQAVKLGIGSLAALGVEGLPGAPAGEAAKPRSHPLLTPADRFQDVSRGNPKPFTLTGEALLKARLTTETWRLEITTDDTLHDPVTQKPKVEKILTLADGTALDYPALLELGKKHRVMFLKAMQCLNISTPLGQGLWEGVPLRDVLRLCGKISNVRRIYFWGFHNDDPAQLFQSSLSYSQVMETPPGELPVFLAYKLNGESLSLLRGGPVRMVVPWAHGFKSIKWLQNIVLTNEYRANDTYAEKNNDPESHLKTAAYLDDVAARSPSGTPVHVSGLAISGWSGLARVEYWVRPAPEKPGVLADDDPAWDAAQWNAGELEAPPSNWSDVLPKGTSSKDVLGFDRKTGRPLTWPLRYGMVSWSATLRGLQPGAYEVRARAVDLNDFAQPEPRSILKSGKNGIESRRFEVIA
jgi:DMSO/TMAO reductase YedYZ molybdopterin-dependent catalytic subunit